MKFGVPWNVKGVRPEVRDSARQAARRSGMSVGEWLNHVIAERATASPADHDDDVGERDAGRDALTERIDRLDQRLGQILAREPAPPAPPPAPAREIIYHADPRAFTPPYPAPGYAPQPPAAYTPPPQNGWANSIEQAVAEISARAECLDAPAASPAAYTPPAYTPSPAFGPSPAASAPPPPMPSYAPPPAASAPMPMPAAAHYAPTPPPVPRFPQQDLSGLEGQLRNITEMIERLHQPKENEEIAALRKELAEISGKLNEAMPKHAIEVLENEMRKIAERLDESRKFGIDPAVIGNMERGLADVYQALKELKPAESLAGFEEAIRNLSLKIEQMGGVSHDPGFVQQLEGAITALRGIVSHVASNEQLGALADEVRGLSAKIERVAGAAGGTSPDFMAALDQKIGALTEQLKASGSPVLPPRIESLLNSFSDRMERNELSSGEQYALGTLEDRIVSLAAKLDASETRLNQLGAIERGMAELLLHIQELRTSGVSAAPRNGDIKREIAKTQDSLEAVHGTVGAVVDRLAILETEWREPMAPVAPVAPMAAQPVPAAPQPAPAQRPDDAYPGPMSIIEAKPASAPAVTVTPPAKVRPPVNRPRAPIDPNLPPDYPLEPGSGVPRGGTSAAERIAASEAALNGINATGSGSSGSTNFIAAARRAAQAAAPAGAPNAKAEPAKSEKPAEHKSLGQRVRSMLAGASVILLVAGGLKLAMSLYDSSDRVAELPTASPAQIANNSDDLNALIQDKAASAPSTRIARMPEAGPPPGLSQRPQPDAEPESQPEVTSSIATAPLPPVTEQPMPGTTAEPRLVPPEKLPAALRNAAMNGDPAAAYEIAMRHLEGRGITQSLEEAARWLERSAKAGLAPAQFRLGSLYEKGQGVKKSLDTAQRLYSAAAQKGNAKAMHNLAVLYAEGAQGKPDYKTAVQWFRKAADRGVADSQYNLGILYARGIGVEQNLAEAYKWFSLAGAQGDKEAAKKRDDVGAKLDAQSLMAARLAAQTFAVEPQPHDASVVKAPEGGWDRANNTTPKPAKKPRTIQPLKITPS